jgi:DNA-binding NarL/FixJ family response regulator
MNTVVIGQNTDVKNAISEILMEQHGFLVNQVSYEKPIKNSEVSQLENADLIILDLSTARTSSRFLIMEVREVFAKAKIIALHIYKELSLVKPLLESGADAYLPVDTSGRELLESIKSIRSGEKFVSRDIH